MAEEHSAILREHVGSSGDGRAPVDGGPAVRGGALDGAGLDAGAAKRRPARGGPDGWPRLCQFGYLGRAVAA